MTAFRTPTASTLDDAGPVVPAARRVQPPGWRDPRLVAGVVIVAVCVLLGARVLATADDTVAVWRVRHDLADGSVLDRSDLVVTRVHLADDVGDRYLPATAGIAPGSRVGHDLAAGELLPRSAVVTGDGPDLVEVPLSVAPDDVPASVRRGATVDVWVTPTAGTGAGPGRARLALADVVVVAVPTTGDSLAPATTRQVIVGVDRGRAGDLADALGEIADGRVVLTRQAGS